MSKTISGTIRRFTAEWFWLWPCFLWFPMFPQTWQLRLLFAQASESAAALVAFA